ncbi:DUF1127 domain-containing protein [Histidinibacterium aquaticum]|nr:DUF1127 domain-containing protein [Histidinibacterium aquaticum]
MHAYTLSFFEGLAGLATRRPNRAHKRRGQGHGLVRWFRLWRDYRHLDELPDYLLKDIGLTRADLYEDRRRFFL